MPFWRVAERVILLPGEGSMRPAGTRSLSDIMLIGSAG
jgi:hypothetical protein